MHHRSISMETKRSIRKTICCFAKKKKKINQSIVKHWMIRSPNEFIAVDAYDYHLHWISGTQPFNFQFSLLLQEIVFANCVLPGQIYILVVALEQRSARLYELCYSVYIVVHCCMVLLSTRRSPFDTNNFKLFLVILLAPLIHKRICLVYTDSRAS